MNGSCQAEPTQPGLSSQLKTYLQELVNSHSVILFTKGTIEAPRCGFSQKVVDILKAEGIKFGNFNISYFTMKFVRG